MHGSSITRLLLPRLALALTFSTADLSSYYANAGTNIATALAGGSCSQLKLPGTGCIQ
jgi:hypothetical protein